jgi:hypothetical protein
MLAARCPSCGHTLEVSEDLRGRRVECPPCGKRFTVPLPESPEAEAAARRLPGAGFPRFAAVVICGAAFLLIVVVGASLLAGRRREPPPEDVVPEREGFEDPRQALDRLMARLLQPFWDEAAKEAPVVQATDLRLAFAVEPGSVKALLRNKTVTVSGRVKEVRLEKATDPTRPRVAIALEAGANEGAHVNSVVLRFSGPPTGKFPEGFLARVKALREGDGVRGIGRLAPLRDNEPVVLDAARLEEEPEPAPFRD